MDDFNYQLNEAPENDAVQQWRNDFGGDVDRVLFEGHDLLSSISCASNQDAHSSFLNPISDMLTDVNFCEQIGIGSTQSMQTSQSHAPPLHSWGVHENVDVSNLPSFINLPDHLKSTDICDGSNSMGTTYNSQSMALANDNSVLLPEPNVEFPAVDCAFFGGDYSSTISQWLQSIEQQQFPTQQSQIPQSILQTSQSYPDALLSTLGTLPASTTITPVTITDDNMVRCSSNIQATAENDVKIEANLLPNNNCELFVPSVRNSMFFAKDEKNDLILGNFENNLSEFQQDRPVKRKAILNVDQNEWRSQLNNVLPLPQSITQQLVHPIHTKDMFQKSLETFANHTNFQHTSIIPFTARQTTDVINQKKHINHNPNFPRKHVIQPPEMIIMHPLRTRKLLSSRRTTVGSAGNSNAVLNLSEYFDTSCINIPMIRERTRTEFRNETRRKQKLHIIPGSEHLVFEVQKRASDEKSALSPKSLNEKILPELDPYPETELPELDEIFKRKKKTAPTNTAGSKKLNAITSSTGGIVLEQTPKNLNENNAMTPQQSSASFEEKVSVSSIVNRKARRNFSIDKQDMAFNSDSDSIESVVEKIDEGTTNVIKSFKCQRCKKFFKTTRSLAIHTKRCASIKRDSMSSSSEVNDECISSIKDKHMSPHVLIKPIRIHLDDFVENNEPKYSGDVKISSIPNNDFHKPRPRTRSQTRSSGQSSSSSMMTKRSK